MQFIKFINGKKAEENLEHNFEFCILYAEFPEFRKLFGNCKNLKKLENKNDGSEFISTHCMPTPTLYMGRVDDLREHNIWFKSSMIF